MVFFHNWPSANNQWMVCPAFKWLLPGQISESLDLTQSSLDSTTVPESCTTFYQTLVPYTARSSLNTIPCLSGVAGDEPPDVFREVLTSQYKPLERSSDSGWISAASPLTLIKHWACSHEEIRQKWYFSFSWHFTDRSVNYQLVQILRELSEFFFKHCCI